jgi:hypothetical protein
VSPIGLTACHATESATADSGMSPDTIRTYIHTYVHAGT